MAREETIVLVGLLAAFLLFSALNDRVVTSQETTGWAITDAIRQKISLPLSNTAIIGGMVIAVLVILLIIVLILKTKRRHKMLIEKKKRFLPSVHDEKTLSRQEEEIDKLFSQEIEKYISPDLQHESRSEEKKGETLKPKAEEKNEPKKEEKLGIDNELVTYIKKAQERKMQRRQIIANLLKAGWKKEDIQSAFLKLHKEKLNGYVRFALKHHQHEDQITDSLVNVGWDRKEVEGVLEDTKRIIAFET